MDELVSEILSRTTARGQNVNIVENPDGFLSREDTRKAIESQSGVRVMPVSQLELRIKYETDCKDKPDVVWLFIVKSIATLLPDIRINSKQSVFNTKDLFLTYFNQGLNLNTLNYKLALQLFRSRPISRQDKHETRQTVEAAQEQFGENGNDISIIKENLTGITVDWHKPKDTIEKVSEYIIKAAKQGLYHEIENELAIINDSFQKDIDYRYFSQMQTATSPKVVHRLLSYILRSYGRDAKIALVVVDGMAYWQYMLLRKELSELGVDTDDNVIYSWLPSITKLSRQAIFRGDKPDRDYKQNPDNEKKLWYKYWMENGYSDFNIQYIYTGNGHDKARPEIGDLVSRIAYVTTTIDEYMHSAANMKQLCRNTEDWAKDFANVIKQIHDNGFIIIMTADHGSVPSYHWGNLSQYEKTYLYADNSRGKRHSIYTQPFAVEEFRQNHQDIADCLLIHNDFICWRGNQCFGNEDCITHGGSNMLEMVVPLITIKN